ncbi:hypothetical protein ROZALSC1DRAFT_31046, partial [Rozella allomycis CSF55]
MLRFQRPRCLADANGKWKGAHVVIQGDYGFETFLFNERRVLFCHKCCSQCKIEVVMADGTIDYKTKTNLFEDKEDIVVKKYSLSYQSMMSLRLSRHHRMTNEVIWSLEK